MTNIEHKAGPFGAFCFYSHTIWAWLIYFGLSISQSSWSSRFPLGSSWFLNREFSLQEFHIIYLHQLGQAEKLAERALLGATWPPFPVASLQASLYVAPSLRVH